MSDFENHFFAPMTSNQPKPCNTLEETTVFMLDSDFVVSSDSELGELSSEEEEMINAGCDPAIELHESRYV